MCRLWRKPPARQDLNIVLRDIRDNHFDCEPFKATVESPEVDSKLLKVKRIPENSQQLIYLEEVQVHG